MSDLSEEALDRLINADDYTGGRLGVTAPGRDESTLAELRAAGLVSAKGNLTRAGAARARDEQYTYFDRPELQGGR